VYSVRLDAEDFAALERLATEWGTTPLAALRRCLRRVAGLKED
jgi:hypothetical protein